MTHILRRGLAVIVTSAAALALAALSTAPFRVHTDPTARLRVAFSARPERIERCRTLSADELANLPQHMRQSELCEGTTAHYRLEVRRNDSLLATALLRGGGLRHDRRLYALRELVVPSGRGTIDVRVTRLDTVAARRDDDAHERDEGEHGDDARRDLLARDQDERRRRVADEIPASLDLREDVTLAPREVLLVTYDQASRRLRTVRDTP